MPGRIFATPLNTGATDFSSPLPPALVDSTNVVGSHGRDARLAGRKR